MSCCCSNTDNWEQVEAAAKAELTPEIVEFIVACHKLPQPSSNLIAALHKVQECFGYLATEKMDAVAQLLRVPAAKVSGVATFYHFFRLQPRGKFMINVCMGTACYVNGAERVAQSFQQELGVDFGQTTTDGLFSLDSALCIGTCALAPVVMINEEVHAMVTPDQVPALLEKAMQSLRTEA